MKPGGALAFLYFVFVSNIRKFMEYFLPRVQSGILWLPIEGVIYFHRGKFGRIIREFFLLLESLKNENPQNLFLKKDDTCG
jgi:hypothetical protein